MSVAELWVPARQQDGSRARVKGDRLTLKFQQSLSGHACGERGKAAVGWDRQKL